MFVEVTGLIQADDGCVRVHGLNRALMRESKGYFERNYEQQKTNKLLANR